MKEEIKFTNKRRENKIMRRIILAEQIESVKRMYNNRYFKYYIARKIIEKMGYEEKERRYMEEYIEYAQKREKGVNK